MDWINRIGIIFDFLSFWFAAPEFLGEARLRAMENVFEHGIEVIVPNLCNFIVKVISFFGILFFIGYLLHAMNLDKLADNLDGGLVGLLTLLILLTSVYIADKVTEYVEKVWVASVLRKLADDSKLRERSLRVGVLMYIIGNVMQLWATF